MKIITRFAPSPTGMLHVGNARTAIINWLFAQANGGKFMLRIDDTDAARSKDEYIGAIKKDMKWLGLNWDRLEQQSTRMDKYNKARDDLIAAGKLYECFETPDELEAKRKLQLSSGRPPIYDRAALNLTDAQKEEYRKQGRKSHYRFFLEPGKIEWNDLVRGKVSFDAEHLSDPILVRADGTMTYMISSSVDDIEFEISHVIRGEDHIANTALQIRLFEALGSYAPTFGHLALITTKDEKISKRKGGFDLESLREENYIEPMAINSLFSALGSSMSVVPYSDMDELIKNFDIKKFSRNSSKYSFDDLLRLNHKIISDLEYKDIKNNLSDIGLGELDEDFWLAIRSNLNNIADAKLWWDICKLPVEKESDRDSEFLNIAVSLLPEGKVTSESWAVWTKLISGQTGKKGKELFMPIRKALTAMGHGPEMSAILPLLGREKILERLQ